MRNCRDFMNMCNQISYLMTLFERQSRVHMEYCDVKMKGNERECNYYTAQETMKHNLQLKTKLKTNNRLLQVSKNQQLHI